MTIQDSIVERANKSNWVVTSESLSKEQFVLKRALVIPRREWYIKER